MTDCHLAQHRCLLFTGYCSRHRRVWGDLVPVEQYRNTTGGRHSLTGNPFDKTVSVILRRMACDLTPTTKDN